MAAAGAPLPAHKTTRAARASKAVTGWHARSARPAGRGNGCRPTSAARPRPARPPRPPHAQQRRSPGPPGNGPARPALDGSAGPGHAPAHRPGGPGSGLWPRSGMPPGTARSARLDRIGRMSPVSSSNDPPPAASVFATWRSSLAIAVLGAIAAAAALSSGMLWQKLGAIQEQLARQSAESGALAIEARTMARQAQELVRETAARLSVAETRISEVALQRSQLEELMQSLSRSRDENLVVDIESAVRLAQQQAQLTGSLEPLVAALKSAQQRMERAAQPRLAPVQRAMDNDLDRLGRASVTDTAGLLARLDDLVRQVDELPVQNAVAQVAAGRRQSGLSGATPAAQPAHQGPPPSWPGAPPAAQPAHQGRPAWWHAALQNGWEVVRDEVRGLARVSRIDQPEAILLAPEQGFFLRENLKLKLLNARLGLLARQFDAARADLNAATAALNKYFDPASRRTQYAASMLQQAQAGMRAAPLPRLDETLSALATAAAGR